MWKKLKIIFGILTALACFYSGWKIGQKSWGGGIFVVLNQDQSRHIASLKPQMNIKVLKGSNLSEESEGAFIEGSQILPAGEEFHIYLGHFLVLAENGAYTPVCEKYEKVRMIFTADGVSSHGHAPIMILKGACQKEGKTLQIGPFIVPKQKIMNSSIKRRVFEGEGQSILFEHVSLYWPSKWVLRHISFSREPAEDNKLEIQITGTENKLSFNLREDSKL